MKKTLLLILTIVVVIGTMCSCNNESSDPITTANNIPQAIFFENKSEVFERLYSLFVSDSDAETIKSEAAKIQALMRKSAPTTEIVGGTSFSGTIHTTGDYVVRTDDELQAALKSAKSGEVIFIPSGVTIDISDLFETEDYTPKIRKGVTLASDRGIGAGGKLVLSHPMGMALICDDDATITGLNISGPVRHYEGYNAAVKDIGIRITGTNVTVSNCEIASFTRAAISLSQAGEANIDSCYIHNSFVAIAATTEKVTVKDTAIFEVENGYTMKNEPAEIPSGIIVLESATIEPLGVERKTPDLLISVFPNDPLEAYQLLEKVKNGETKLLVEALASYSGTTEYYHNRESLTIEQDGKVYGISKDTALGGGIKYRELFNDADHVVSNLAELKSALESVKSGETIFINGNAELNLTNNRITIPAGVTLASNRGAINEDGKVSGGAMLYSTIRQDKLITMKEGSRLVGVTVVGADTERHMTHLERGLNSSGDSYTDYYYSLTLTRGVCIEGDGVSVSNCEVSGFSEAGIAVINSKSAVINNNFIHHNQRNGFGYGIVFYGPSVGEVYGNVFNYDRHAIAADGTAGSGYSAHDNIHLGTAIYHIFDAHGSTYRDDGTRVACDKIDMKNNVFMSIQLPYKRRGTPEEYSKFTNNIIIYPESSYQYRYLYGKNFICEDNIWGIMEAETPNYNFENGKTFTIDVKGEMMIYKDVAEINSKTHGLRYKYFLVFAPSEDGYYVCEYGNNLDDGSILGENEVVRIPENGFVLTFTSNHSKPLRLYKEIAARHGVIYNSSMILNGDYIATFDGSVIKAVESVEKTDN